MTRKLAGAAAALTLVAVSLAGCQSGGSSGGDAAAVKELNIPAVEAPWLAQYKTILQKYTKETGVKINVTSFPFDGLLTQEANAAQSGSNAFDAFLINEQWTGQFYDNQWVQKLTDINPDFKWDKNLIEFDGIGRWDSKKRDTSPQGDPYALPVNGNIHEFMYRKDLYAKLGLAVPKTWDEVIANGKKAVAAKQADNGYVLRGKTPSYDFSSVLYSFKGSFFANEQSGDWKPTVDTPEFRKALETFKALADIGPKAPQTIAQAEAISLMQGGRTLQGELVTASAAPLEDKKGSNIAGKVGYATTPGNTPVSGTWVMGVPIGLDKDKAAAVMKFMTWLTSQKTMQAWADDGGVTTRSDVKSDRPDLKVLVDSADSIRGGFRYTFTPAFLEVTDPALGAYVAGKTSLDETVSTLQSGLTKVVKDAGYLK